MLSSTYFFAGFNDSIMETIVPGCFEFLSSMVNRKARDLHTLVSLSGLSKSFIEQPS